MKVSPELTSKNLISESSIVEGRNTFTYTGVIAINNGETPVGNATIIFSRSSTVYTTSGAVAVTQSDGSFKVELTPGHWFYTIVGHTPGINNSNPLDGTAGIPSTPALPWKMKFQGAVIVDPLSPPLNISNLLVKNINLKVLDNLGAPVPYAYITYTATDFPMCASLNPKVCLQTRQADANGEISVPVYQTWCTSECKDDWHQYSIWKGTNYDNLPLRVAEIPNIDDSPYGTIFASDPNNPAWFAQLPVTLGIDSAQTLTLPNPITVSGTVGFSPVSGSGDTTVATSVAVRYLNAQMGMMSMATSLVDSNGYWSMRASPNQKGIFQAVAMDPDNQFVANETFLKQMEEPEKEIALSFSPHSVKELQDQDHYYFEVPAWRTVRIQARKGSVNPVPAKANVFVSGYDQGNSCSNIPSWIPATLCNKHWNYLTTNAQGQLTGKYKYGTTFYVQDFSEPTRVVTCNSNNAIFDNLCEVDENASQISATLPDSFQVIGSVVMVKSGSSVPVRNASLIVWPGSGNVYQTIQTNNAGMFSFPLSNFSDPLMHNQNAALLSVTGIFRNAELAYREGYSGFGSNEIPYINVTESEPALPLGFHYSILSVDLDSPVNIEISGLTTTKIKVIDSASGSTIPSVTIHVNDDGAYSANCLSQGSQMPFVSGDCAFSNSGYYGTGDDYRNVTEAGVGLTLTENRNYRLRVSDMSAPGRDQIVDLIVGTEDTEVVVSLPSPPPPPIQSTITSDQNLAQGVSSIEVSYPLLTEEDLTATGGLGIDGYIVEATPIMNDGASLRAKIFPKKFKNIITPTMVSVSLTNLETSTAVTGLIPGVRYYIDVRSWNAAGVGKSRRILLTNGYVAPPPPVQPPTYAPPRVQVLPSPSPTPSVVVPPTPTSPPAQSPSPAASPTASRASANTISTIKGIEKVESGLPIRSKVSNDFQSSPIIKIAVGQSISPVLKDLPGSAAVIIRLIQGKKILSLGSRKTSSKGGVTVPAFKPSISGNYTLEITTKSGKKFFTRISVKPKN